MSPVLLDPAVRSVAVVRLRTGLGDLLCTTPSLRALRAARPDVRVTLVTWAEMAPVVERMGVDEHLDFPGHPGIPERPPQLERWDGWVRDVRARRFDLALQAYGANPAANEVVAAMGAARTGGFFATTGLERTGPLDLSTHVPYPFHLHEVDRHLHLLAHLGVPPAGSELELPLTADDRVEADRVRARAALVAGEYVVLHPGATSSSRLWPAPRFAAVAAALVEQGWRVAVTGVPAERGVVDAVLAALPARALTASGPGVVDLCGATGLGGFAAVLDGAALLVTNDTGAAHAASALGVRSVVVFLSGDPRRWAAPDTARHVVVREQVECSPCPHLDCPIDFRCATRVGPERVLAAARDLLPARARQA